MRVSSVNRLLIAIMLVLLVSFTSPLVNAKSEIVINSRDWHEVYSGLLYSGLRENNEITHYVLPDTGQGVALYQEGIIDRNNSVILIESKNPAIFGYESQLIGARYNVSEVISEDNLNFELGKKITESKNIKKFIILDGALGYDSIAIAPYALLTDSYVFYADKNNMNQITGFLEEKADKVLIYGRVEREVREKLKKFNPETINNEDRYLDNIEIVKKFIELTNVSQITLTEGDFMETGLFTEEFPSLLIGTSNIPDSVMDYLDNSEIKAAIVIGYDLYDNALQIRRATGIRVFLKYGMGLVGNTDPVGKVYALNNYPIPGYTPEITIKDVRYNTLTKQLEVIYENKGDVYTYFRALSHDLRINNNTIKAVGDQEALFIEKKSTVATLYDLDLTNYTGEKITAFSKVAFGEGKSSLAFLLEENRKINTIALKDNSKIEIRKIEYNKQTKRFELEIENTEEESVYANPEIVDLIINDEKTTIGGEQQRIPPKSKKIFKIKANLYLVDIEDNPLINIKIRYGSREDALIKSLKEERDLKIKTDMTLILIIAAVVALLIIAFILMRKRQH